jgi:hypothetical protein
MYIMYATSDSRTVNKLENKIKVVTSALLVPPEKPSVETVEKKIVKSPAVKSAAFIVCPSLVVSYVKGTVAQDSDSSVHLLTCPSLSQFLSCISSLSVMTR